MLKGYRAYRHLWETMMPTRLPISRQVIMILMMMHLQPFRRMLRTLFLHFLSNDPSTLITKSFLYATSIKSFDFQNSTFS